MFCNKPKNVTRNVPTKRSRKRKKKSYPQCDKKAKLSKGICQNPSNLATAMSSWAQTYTEATTWQLKHQVAYWKARAKALEYENRVLHDTIRQNYLKSATEHTAVEADESEPEDNSEESEYEEEQEDDFEVSEEFIEFLRQNAKYKEDAKREKARLKAKIEAENNAAQTHEIVVESSEEKKTRFIQLYGDNWERIMALETSVTCDFINQCDRDQPEYWPNIPFNL